MAQQYAGRRKLYDFEEQDATSLPPAGYLWTNAAPAGISMRNFGYMVNNKPRRRATGEEQITGCARPGAGQGHEPHLPRRSTSTYPDVERAKVFLAELAEYEKTGTMPRLIVMRLGNDHTSGTAAGKIAPLSAAADNDYALGMIVEGRVEVALLDAAPRSSCWKTMRRTGRTTWIRTARRRS